MKTPPATLAESKERWDIRLKEADVVYKVLILIVGSIVAAVFLFLQNKQNDSRYYADLMAQRERADSDLRAEMFKVLFEAYFKNKIQKQEAGDATSPPSGTGLAPAARRTPHQGSEGELLEALRQESMLSDLLARNFDNIDIRPLLEDLEDRLNRHIGSAAEKRHLAFRQREQLRRVASGAISRQVAALEGLAGKAKARVSYHGINTCTLDTGLDNAVKNRRFMSLVNPPLPPEVQRETGPIELVRLRDGALDLHITQIPKGDKAIEASDLGAAEMNLTVSFFDMPTFENVRMNNGERVAFSLYKYLSKNQCINFKGDLDESLQADCEDLMQSKNDCEVVQFRTVILPSDFIGVHDRPYVNDLASGKYRAAWWKIW